MCSKNPNNIILIRVCFQSICVPIITFEKSSNDNKSKNGGESKFFKTHGNTFLQIIFPYDIQHGIFVFVVRLGS